LPESLVLYFVFETLIGVKERLIDIAKKLDISAFQMTFEECGVNFNIVPTIVYEAKGG